MESVFETKEQYFEFINNWKEITNSEQKSELTLQHFILYRMLRRKDWTKCLSESSKEQTLEDAKNWATSMNPAYLSLWPFKGVTASMITKLREQKESN